MTLNRSSVLFAITLFLLCAPTAAAEQEVPPPQTPETTADAKDGEKKPQSPTPIISLEHAPAVVGTFADGGLLVRELYRQALLIAAREHFGLVTRDEVLREPADQGLQIKLTTAVYQAESIRLKITKQAGGQEQVIWEKRVEGPFTIDGFSDMRKLLETAERLSRTDFVEFFADQGLKRRETAKSDAETDEKRGEIQIGRLNIVDQFAQIRRLHSAMQTGEESDALVEQLAVTYALLGQLTQFHWNASHEVYKARSLLYGQRLVTRNDKSCRALWVLAFAKILAGMHTDAQKDVTRSRELMDAQEQKITPPDWIRVADRYWRFMSDDLVKFESDDEDVERFAKLLALLAVEYGYSRATVLSFAEKAAAASPECCRIYDVMCGVGGVSNLHGATMLSQQAGAGHAARLEQLADLPDSVTSTLKEAQMIDRIAPEDGLRQKLLPAHLRAAKSLVEAGDGDSREPSWTVLGRMIQETAFVQYARRLLFMRDKWNVPTAEEAEVYLRRVGDHPYRNFIACFRHPRWSKEHLALLKELNIRDADLSQTPMMLTSWHSSTPNQWPAREAYDNAFYHADVMTANDANERINQSNSPEHKSYYAKLLQKVNPNSPFAMATLITNDWDYIKDFAAKWEEFFADSLPVMTAFAKKYFAENKYDKVISILDRYITRSADKWAYVMLADCHLNQGNEEKWLATLDEFLTKRDTGLEHASVRVKVARHMMEQQRYEDALPYAEAAAQTWASWAMRCASECHEGLENWEASETWIRRVSERYVGGGARWYFWCVRTGRGDAERAKVLADQWAKRFQYSTNHTTIQRRATMQLIDGKKRETLFLFRSLFERHGGPFDGFHWALLADMLDDAAGRNTALARIVEFSEGHNHDFALLLKSNLENSFADPDHDKFDELIKELSTHEQANFAYFWGSFIELHQPGKGIGYLKQCAESNDVHGWNYVLACHKLRNRTGDSSKEVDP